MTRLADEARRTPLAVPSAGYGVDARLSACGSGDSLPNQPGLPAIKADPANRRSRVRSKRVRPLPTITAVHRDHAGQASDPFWAVVQNGAEAAGRQLGVSVTHEAPDTSDVARMNQLIDAAIAANPSGLVASLPDPTALSYAVRKAERAGIPVISINSGADAFRQLGILVHVGQDEYQAGFSAEERMGAAHVRNALCVIHETQNLSLRQRCRGFPTCLA